MVDYSSACKSFVYRNFHLFSKLLIIPSILCAFYLSCNKTFIVYPEESVSGLLLLSTSKKMAFSFARLSSGFLVWENITRIGLCELFSITSALHLLVIAYRTQYPILL